MKNVGVSELMDSIRLVASGAAIVYSSMAAKLLSEPDGVNNGRMSNNGQAGLSAREKEVLTLVASGASNKEIASHCSVSSTTVKAHLRRILEKLEVKNRAQAAALAVEKGYLN
jgi:DNA-binding NarL/FixJ family response regulator